MNPRARTTTGLVLASTLLALVAACSGANTSDLFDPSASTFRAEPTPTDGTSGSNESPGSSGSSLPGSSGTNGVSGSSGGSGTSGSNGSSGTSGSNGSSGTTDAGTDASTWKSPGIICGEDQAGGDLYCGNPLLCCVRSNRGFGDKSYECTSPGIAACAGGTAVRCDDRSDCPSGQVCCGSFDQNIGYRSVQCQTSCNGSPIPNVTTVRFCDPYAPTDECADIGKTCTPSQSLEGFSVCK